MTNGGFLSKGRIAEFRDKAFAEVHVPEWEGVVRIRRMNVGDRIALAEGMKQGDNDLMFMVKVVAYSLCDENGQRIFSDDELGDILRLDQDPVRRVYDAAMKLSKVRPVDVDEAEKNSETSQSANSPIN